jgi:hypothetical protein
MKHIPKYRHWVSPLAATAQFVEEAEYKIILDVLLILKPSTSHARQKFIRRNL